jgi:hypothetical protein
MDSIESAFTQACSPHHLLNGPSAAKKRKVTATRLRLRIADDEEEEDTVMVDRHPTASGSGKGDGGFILDDTRNDDAMGGGFMLEEDEGDNAAGGFIVDSPGQGGGEGGFLPESSPLDAESDAAGSPQHPLPNLLPLSSLSRAFDALPTLPRSARYPLMEAFGIVAETNEDGVKCISRDKFIEACSVIIREEYDDDQENDDAEAERDEDENGDVESQEGEEEWEDEEMRGKVSRRQRGATNIRTTRSNAASTSTAMVIDPLIGEEIDDDEAEASSNSDSRPTAGSKTSAKSKSKAPVVIFKSKGKGKAKEKVGKKNRVLTAEEVIEAEETFDLFFEGSIQRELGITDREITMEELRRVSRLLEEKNSEEEVSSIALVYV